MPRRGNKRAASGVVKRGFQVRARQTKRKKKPYSSEGDAADTEPAPECSLANQVKQRRGHRTGWKRKRRQRLEAEQREAERCRRINARANAALTDREVPSPGEQGMAASTSSLPSNPSRSESDSQLDSLKEASVAALSKPAINPARTPACRTSSPSLLPGNPNSTDSSQSNASGALPGSAEDLYVPVTEAERDRTERGKVWYFFRRRRSDDHLQNDPKSDRVWCQKVPCSCPGVLTGGAKHSQKKMWAHIKEEHGLGWKDALWEMAEALANDNQ
eukprot:TRINITY_DN105034_c0_g1_i1.p1 TRINITY_DN105034_c0_g1~~TRINITY_DN105034_c0_g1_i1.p1  ORF type:complete len:274 (-),score=36.69 TRINITY_DN105034_c0_g1_i1:126-947(-)